MSIVDYLEKFNGYTLHFLFYFSEYNCKKKLVEVCDNEYSYIGFAQYFAEDHIYFYDFLSDIEDTDCDISIDDSRSILYVEFESSNPPEINFPVKTPMDEKWGC